MSQEKETATIADIEEMLTKFWEDYTIHPTHKIYGMRLGWIRDHFPAAVPVHMKEMPDDTLVGMSDMILVDIEDFN